MDAAVFQQLCLRTERQVDSEVIERFEDVAGRLTDLMRDASEIASEADQLKRHIFYGKPFDGEDGDVEPSVVLRMEEDLRAIHGLLGLISEVGELVDVHFGYYDGITSSIDQVNVLEELGDIGWYSSVMASTANGNLGEAYEVVIDKLSERYPNSFTEQDALVRNLEAERRALENRVDGTGLF